MRRAVRPTTSNGINKSRGARASLLGLARVEGSQGQTDRDRANWKTYLGGR